MTIHSVPRTQTLSAVSLFSYHTISSSRVFSKCILSTFTKNSGESKVCMKSFSIHSKYSDFSIRHNEWSTSTKISWRTRRSPVLATSTCSNICRNSRKNGVFRWATGPYMWFDWFKLLNHVKIQSMRGNERQLHITDNKPIKSHEITCIRTS